VLPYTDASSPFVDAFIISFLPELPMDANFNSIVLNETEWADATGVDPIPPPVPSEDDIYVYGDEEKLDVTNKDDWRRAAYMIIWILHSEGVM